MRPLARTTTLLVAAALVGCAPAEEPAPEGDAVEQAEVGGSDAQQLGAPYIGMGEDEALAFAQERDIVARVGTAADVAEPGQTDDYEVGRLTFVVADGVVVEVIVETENGPQTVAAG